MSKEKSYLSSCGVYIMCFCALCLTGGCGGSDKSKLTDEELALIPLSQREGLPECSGGFVLSVSGEVISSEEVIAPLMAYLTPIAQKNSFDKFSEHAKPAIEQILTTQIVNLLLYQQAKKNAGEQIDEQLDKAAAAEVQKFIANFGGDYAKAEQSLAKAGLDWTSFKEHQKKMIMGQSYLSSKMPVKQPITHSELVARYNEIKDEAFGLPAIIKFRLIDIETAKLEKTDPNRNKREQAQELAGELINRIDSGEDFGALARQYSHGYRAGFGGLWEPVQPGSLAEPYDILADEAERMEPGQIAGPIGAGERIFIVKLEEKQTASFEPLEKVQKQVEMQIALERQKKVVDELVAQLAKQAAIGEQDKFIDFCLEEIYRRSNQ